MNCVDLNSPQMDAQLEDKEELEEEIEIKDEPKVKENLTCNMMYAIIAKQNSVEQRC